MQFFNHFEPEADRLIESPGSPFFVAGDQVAGRLEVHETAYSLHLHRIDRAMKRGSVDHFMMDVVAGPNLPKEEAIRWLFLRYDSVLQMVERLDGLKWKLGADSRYLPIHFSDQGLTCWRWTLPCASIYSPFVRTEILRGLPSKWDKKTVVRALTSGQFDHLYLPWEGVVVEPKGPYQPRVTFPREKSGLSLAYLMVEVFPGPWIVESTPEMVYLAPHRDLIKAAFVPRLFAERPVICVP